MAKLMITREIQAPPEKVFAFVISGRMNRVWGEWMDSNWISEGPVGLGSMAHFYTKGLLRSFGELTGEVTEFEENRKMTLSSKDDRGRTIVTDTLILEPTANGTSATYVTEYKVPYSVFGMLIDKVIISKDMENMHVKMLGNLKKVIERLKEEESRLVQSSTIPIL